MEQALRASEERLRLITNALPVLICYIDADAIYRFNNTAYEEWFRCARTAITNRPVSEVLSSTIYDLVRPHLEAALHGDETEFGFFAAYPDGKRRNVSGLYIPHRSLKGEILGVVGILQDVTERTRVEAGYSPF